MNDNRGFKGFQLMKIVIGQQFTCAFIDRIIDNRTIGKNDVFCKKLFIAGIINN
jgi:hypothetical protein